MVQSRGREEMGGRIYQISVEMEKVEKR